MLAASLERFWSVSSIRSTNVPPFPFAKAQQKSAVRAPPTWRCPDGLGAKRVTMVLEVELISGSRIKQTKMKS